MIPDAGAAAATLRMVRLLQLASPALPIGAFSYSQALERVVEDGVVRDLATAQQWIGDLLEHVVAPGEAALAARLIGAVGGEDFGAALRWNAWFRASRESAELRAETEQMGGSLAKLVADLGLADDFACRAVDELRPITLPAAWALAARALGIADDAALCAYVWSWLDNQVMAAVKAVPLGQVAGQRLLLVLGARLPAALAVAWSTPDDAVTSFAPQFAIASARHETQYTRLFRS
jgi:urease accessory protein